MNRGTARTLTALAAVVIVWLCVVGVFGVRFVALRPSGGILPYTFEGWAQMPASRHLYLAQYEPDDFASGRVYDSHPYPVLFLMYLVLAPLRALLGMPYEVAHNVLSALNVVALTALLAYAARDQLREILETRQALIWLVGVLAIGVLVTAPQPWISTLLYDRDNLYILTAGVFCFLSTWVFYDRTPGKALLWTGLFIALWLPIYIPAWILAKLFFQRVLVLSRAGVYSVAVVCILAALNQGLPKLICRWSTATCIGSGFRFRSGLDGSTRYMTSVYGAVFSPAEPRHWPLAFYVLMALAMAVAFQWAFRARATGYRPLRQVAFLAVPYATSAIIFPQLTSLHPFSTDPLITVPACFVVAFWSVQREFWSQLTGRSFVAWVLAVALILMTNLLTIAQNLRP